MKRFLLSFAAIITLNASAYAGGMQGNYTGRGEGLLSLKINGAHLTMGTNLPGHCVGEISGPFTKTNEHIIQISRKNQDGSCELTLYFDDNFHSVSVKEGECLGFHGASCGFDGVLKKKN